MHHTRFSAFLLVCLMILLTISASALETECDQVYCFSQEDFGQALAGICILSLPDASSGTLLLGSRVLQPGDILSAAQMEEITFHPLASAEEQSAVLRYLPVFSDHVAPETTMVLSIHGKEDKAPAAEDFAVETYKNLPSEGKLKVADPEGQPLRYTLVREPKRGTVTLNDDGSFVYTPKKNKVGVDSFVYTATDPAGNVSREATVTVKILRPADAKQYSDTTGTSCRFAAEWMKNEGIFLGEEVAGQRFFHPDRQVTRGEFLAMTLQALKIPVEDTAVFHVEATPDWLAASMSAALRCGMLYGLPQNESFGADVPITGAEAAVILQNLLQLPPVQSPSLASVDGVTTYAENPISWAEDAIAVMAENGISLSGEILTRGQTAEILYRAAKLADSAPGISLYR